MTNQNRAFLSLDGLRGAAALAVLVYHSPRHSYGLPGAYLAVDLFFCLSGFVLSYVYEKSLRDGLSPRRFLQLRWARLFPLFAISLILGAFGQFLLSPIGESPLLSELAVGLLFLPYLSFDGLANKLLFPLNIPAWSLFMEMLVNVIFAVIAPHLTTRRLLSIIAVGAVWIIFSAQIDGALSGGWGFDTIATGLARVLFSFFGGVALYRAYDAKVAPWLRLPTWVAIGATIILFAIPTSTSRFVLDPVIVLFLLPLIIFAASRDKPPRILAPTLQTLGAASYGVYILQEPLLRFTTSFFDWLVHPEFIERGVFGPSFLIIVVVVCSLLATYYCEQPIRSILTRLLIGQVKPPHPPAAGTPIPGLRPG
jgi:peptidoglycan/LPS O-acetylase OafA/YrhL